MRTSDAIEYYGTQAKLARAAEVKPQAITQWIATGVVPPATAIQLEIKTKGELAVKASAYAKPKKRKK